MGWWLIDADTLAASRFLVSPLAETTAALKTLQRGSAAHPGEQAWRDVHLPPYRDRMAGDPVTALLLRAALGRAWNADFLTPTPTGEGTPTFVDEVRRIRDTPAASARADLVVSLGGSLPTDLQRDDLPERLAGLLEWVWAEAVLPYWPQRRRVIEADIVARTAQLGLDGWVAALDGMRPGMRWLGGSRLQINTQDNPPRELTGVRLFFVPVTPRASWVTWAEPDHYSIVFPCSGALAEVDHRPVPETLAALLGPARAGVLVRLDTPMSTTQLVAVTGQGLGSVGRHLKVLLDAGLLSRRRTGRSVLYFRSDTGNAVVRGNQGPGPDFRARVPQAR